MYVMTKNIFSSKQNNRGKSWILCPLFIQKKKNDGHGIYLPKSKQTYRLRNSRLFDQILLFSITKNSIIFFVRVNYFQNLPSFVSEILRPESHTTKPWFSLLLISNAHSCHFNLILDNMVFKRPDCQA